MQGIVLKTDVKSDNGIIRTDDGGHYPFKIQETHGAAVCGTTVDFTVSEGKAVDVVVQKMPWCARFDWLFWFLFSVRGRISRDQFLAYLSGVSILMPFVVLFCRAVFRVPAVFVLGLFPFMVFLSAICVITKRFHDTNHSGVWLWIMITTGLLGVGAGSPVFGVEMTPEASLAILAVNGLAIAYCLYLCCITGNICPNKYGNEPYVCVTKFLK